MIVASYPRLTYGPTQIYLAGAFPVESIVVAWLVKDGGDWLR